MPAPFRQNLPLIAAYRAEFVASGVTLPLPSVSWRSEGMLAALPPPPSGRKGWPWDVQTAPFASSAAGWPKITVVTPSFQQGDYLEETLRSVLLQNYPLLEFIVLDGGSSDGSPGIINRYRPWLSFARVARDRGQSHAINLGFSLGSGDIHCWLNSDDFFLPGTLLRVAEAWKNGAEFIYGDLLELNQQAGRLIHAFSNLACGRYVRFPGLVPQPSAFWSAARHQPLWEEQHCALDYELWIRLLPGLRTRHLGRPLSVARLHDAAKTYNPAMKKRWNEDSRRNVLAHPELYRKNLGARLLAREFRLVQRLWQARRRRDLAALLESVRHECGWAESPFAS